MPTAHTQHLADLAAVLADPSGPAINVVVNSTATRAIRDAPSLLTWTSEGGLVERQTLYLLRAALGFCPVTGQELVVDGARWLVESCPPDDVIELHLMRYRT